MRPILLWAKQPTTLLAFALVAAAVSYWFTRSAAIAAGVAAAILGGVNDQTRDLLTRMEAMEDTVNSAAQFNSKSAVIQPANTQQTGTTSLKSAI